MLEYIFAFFTILIYMVLIIRKPKVETVVLYVLTVLPLMNTKILPLAYGFVKTFDVITVMSFVIFFKQFFTFEKSSTSWSLLTLTILFWILTLLSSINSEFGFNNPHLLYQVFTIFIYTRFLIIYCSKNWENRYKLINAFKTGFIAALFFMGLQMVIGLKFSITGLGPNVYDPSTGLIRYPGVFADSQYNSQFLAMGSFVYLVYRKYYSNLNLNYLAFIVTIVFLILAGGRSALGGFLIGLFILFLNSSSQVKLYGVLAGVIFLGAFILVAPQSGLFSRADNLGDDLAFRQEIWKETYEIIKEKPLLGIGFGNFKPYTTKYHNDLYLEITPGEYSYFNQPENGYLKILVEQGSLVFAIFLLFILTAITRTSMGLYFKKIDENSIFYLAALASWLVSFNTVYSLLDYRILTMVGTLITMLSLTTRNTINLKKVSKLLPQNNFLINKQKDVINI